MARFESCHPKEEMTMSLATQNALLLMLPGMVGIFAVMILIMIAVNVLNKFAKDKKEEK